MSADSTAALPLEGSERLLLSELSHRLLNELTAAVVVIEMACTRVRNAHVRQTLEAVRESLMSFARVHQALHAPQPRSRINTQSYLRHLCEAIQQAKLRQNGIALQYTVQASTIDAEKCWKLGMIIFELVTNSAKHAFSGSPGTIRVELNCVRRTLQCRVTDNGSSHSSLAEPGTGLKIVNALVRELGGIFSQRVDVGGWVSTVTFPL